jgi:hypothetical protein
LPSKSEPGNVANAVTCQPTTSAMMAPSANTTIVRLLTTESPCLFTHYRISVSQLLLQSWLLTRPSNLPTSPQSSEPIMLFSLRHLLSLHRKFGLWRFRVVKYLRRPVSLVSVPSRTTSVRPSLLRVPLEQPCLITSFVSVLNLRSLSASSAWFSGSLPMLVSRTAFLSSDLRK